jgi:ectoine hydroxylase-related dioxygenase (phytanoyl-CoA dioxygenase family)
VTSTHTDAGGWFDPQACTVEDLARAVDRHTVLADYPYAEAVEQDVLVYGQRARTQADTEHGRRAVQAEMARALLDGPGIVLFAGAFPDLTVVDRATEAFSAMIAAQKAAGATAGDHFATPGANDRVWGALDKLALRDPELFADYYANDVLALVAYAWLGPGYQVTSQVNVVNPGGPAQVPHRDYHLGFMSAAQAALFPAHVHRLSPAPTLQGAVAHCDMPVETGPTLYLPYSQHHPAGYVAVHRPEVASYFADHHVQLPLRAGDAVFFNPALIHGAGANRSTDVRRMANLLQVSSAFGRAMETVDRAAVVAAVYPTLRRRRGAGMDGRALGNVVAAAAEGYPFPTDLDRDQPVDGLAPQSQADLVRRALEQDWSPTELLGSLTAHQARRTGSAPRSLHGRDDTAPPDE